MSDNKEILYTETNNYKFRKDSPDNYYNVEVVNDNLDKIDKTLKDIKDKSTNIQSDWNEKNSGSDAFIKNKPTSLPANGGTADTIKNTLPINKGGTGATSAVNALKNLNLLNYNINTVPSCAPLVYKNYTDFGIASTTMHGFFKTIPENSFFIFENNKNASSYISDSPYTLGIIYAFKGYIHNCHALFFTGQGGGNIIYHYLCNRDIVLQNWTKINDNGNADTVDGYHASAFATASQITTINNTLNNKVDKVSGKGLSTNDFTAAYKSKLDGVQSGAEQNIQSDWNITDTASDAFIKNKPTSIPANGGTADTIKNTLPINKGGTGATDAISALKNLNLLNNNFKNNPSCSALTYKNYSDFGIASMTMFGFAALVPDYSTLIFSNSKTISSYITDAPTEDGIIILMRGALNHRVALFFSTANNNRGVIYQWSSNSAVLLQNWTKINDNGDADTVDGKHASEFATNSQVTSINTALNNKVDKVAGKGLSTNDFTTAYKSKLDGVQIGAETNVQSDWNITDTASDAFIKNKPQNLVNKIELPTMCPQGFYKEYTNINLEPNSWYRIAFNKFYYRANGLFMLTVLYEESFLCENHLTFSISASEMTDSPYCNSKISILTNSSFRPIINKIRVILGTGSFLAIDVKTTDLEEFKFENCKPYKSKIYLNYMGRVWDFKPVNSIEKIETGGEVINEIAL